ncbi:hypothetical protein ES703_67725 [subsurface metagenome]
MFLRVAVGEAKSGRLAMESTQRIYPSIVYPWSETPAAVIVVEVGVLEFAFDKDILKTGVRDLFQLLGKVLVAGLRPGMKSFSGSRQNIRDDVAAIHPLVLRGPRLIPVIAGAVVHFVAVYVGIQSSSFDARPQGRQGIGAWFKLHGQPAVPDAGLYDVRRRQR